MNHYQLNLSQMQARSEAKRTVEWWAGHFDADVHLRYNFKSPVLDVGCGTGEKDILFARDGLEVVGFDFLPFCIDVANEHKIRENLTNVSFRLADICEMWPFPDNNFQTVFSANVLEHLEPSSNDYFFHEAHRVLKHGGALLLIVPELEAYYDPAHLQFFKCEDFASYQSLFVRSEILVEAGRIHFWGVR